MNVSESAKILTENGGASFILASNESKTEHINSTADVHPYIPVYLYVLVSLFNVCIFVFGLIGNVLVVLVIVKVRNMRTSTNLFLLSLSVADMMVLLFCQPAALMEFYAKDRWMIGTAMCKLIPLLENGALSVSIMTIIAVTAERYNAICHPFKRNITCTKATATRMAVLIWILGFLLCSPFMIMTDSEKALFYDGTPIEVCRTRVDSLWRYIYIVVAFIIFFMVPVFLLAYMYACTIRQLVSDELNLFHAVNTRSAVLTLRTRKQVVRMLIFIVILFFISLCPFRIVTLWLIFTPTEKVIYIGLEGYLNLMSFSRIMMYINSAGNPIIYSLTSTKFKAAFKRVLRSTISRSSFGTQRCIFGPKKQDSSRKKELEVCAVSPNSPLVVLRLFVPARQDSKDSYKSEVLNNAHHLQFT